jgi:hypothetical protein
MVWLVLYCVVTFTLAGGWWTWRRRKSEVDADSYQVIVALHLIRRRLDVFQFRAEARRDAADLRRQLHDELRDIDRRERRP